MEKDAQSQVTTDSFVKTLPVDDVTDEMVKAKALEGPDLGKVGQATTTSLRGSGQQQWSRDGMGLEEAGKGLSQVR